MWIYGIAVVVLFNLCLVLGGFKMISIIFYNVLFFVVLIGLGIPLGKYCYKVMTGQKVWLDRLVKPVEKVTYRLIGQESQKKMTAKTYGVAVIAFSFFSFLAVFLIMLLQGLLPLNPAQLKGTSLSLAFNTALSFTTNTNWQAYSGETTLSTFSQIFGLTVQNFVSAAIGISVLFVLLRGFMAKKQKEIGNFWQDLTKSTLYILLPISIVIALFLVSQGVVQSFSGPIVYDSLEKGVKSWLYLGTAASQVAIKQLGTNGGGYFGSNSAHPFENPTVLSNFVENISILLIPMALLIAFGYFVKDHKQGRTLFIVTMIIFVLALVGVTLSELHTSPEFAELINMGNLEGKETRFGVGWSALWAVSTTAASNGSVNGMMDSFTPLGGMIPMFLMQLGEIVFGGAGSGLYGLIAFLILTVFIAGLLVGRTPEYLGKKIEPFDMKMVCLVVLTPPLMTLLGTMSFVLWPQAESMLTNSGAHGFSEILYAFSSLANNNGSAFAGLQADTSFLNVVGGLTMLVVRFIPMIAVIFLGENLAKKKTVAISEGTLSTTNGTFVGMLFGVIILVGALSFLPALALGPIADFLTMK